MHKVISSNAELKAEISIPGDKSITHRTVMFAALANGESRIETNALGRDNFATIRIFRQLGVPIRLELSSSMMELACSEGLADISTEHDLDDSFLYIEGAGADALTCSREMLDCGNSGTTARLVCGILAHTDFVSTLTGDHSLQKRPFARIAEPLGKMGVGFDGERLPLQVKGARSSRGKDVVTNEGIRAQTFELKKASAQVKSAILLTGLHAEGVTRVIEPVKSRDHTERMLESMGGKIKVSDLPDGRYQAEIQGVAFGDLSPLKCKVPGDFSSAMFFIVAALIRPQQEINNQKGVLVKNVGMNPTRIGALDILRRMGANFEIKNEREAGGEPVADLLVHTSKLKGVFINEIDVAKAIDEIPVLAVAAAFAEGRTEVRGAEELRVKESDRITMVVDLLRAFGVEAEEFPDGLGVKGSPESVLEARTSGRSREDSSGEMALWKACGDHRISMAAAILQFSLGQEAHLYDFAAVETSFPTFLTSFSG